MSGAWDCHAHLFGPYGSYPLAADRSYTPPEAPLSDYLALLNRLGFGHGVLVHPSAYGDDLSLMLHALAERPELRGVAVLREATVARLRELRAQGVRGLRFSHRGGAAANFAGSASLDDLFALAPAMAEAGVHAELWTDCTVLPSIAARLRSLPVPLVVDHMAMFDARAGIDEPGFRELLSLVEGGFAKVKLCAYRNLLGQPDPEIGRPFHRALLQADPGALIWGSDWPHLRVEPRPDAALLLALMRAWTDDAALAQAILVDNPRRLYA